MNSAGVPAISGMVKIPPNDFLVVHDPKALGEPRLGILNVQEDRLRYEEIDIHHWPSFEELPNDVEGICAIPGRPGEYLMVESGFYKSKYGRVIKIRYPGGSVSGAEYIGSFRPFSRPADGRTPKHELIEGIAAVAADGTTALLLALRGSSNSERNEPDYPGYLVWGTLSDTDKPNPEFEEIGRKPLTVEAIGNRGAADLFARPFSGSENRWEVLSVATLDPDKQVGPFLSAVYSAGFVTIDADTITFDLHPTCNVLWHVQGMKVEAIAAPADLFGKTSELSIATDDELYQGVWRPLPPTKGPQIPSKMLFIENVLAAPSRSSGRAPIPNKE